MKNNGLKSILNWALIAVVILTTVFAFQWFNRSREARSLQNKVMEFQNKQAMLQNLVAECLEYSKRVPAIDPILEANNVKPGKTAAAPAKPAGK
jgi:hypothetical protein